MINKKIQEGPVLLVCVYNRYGNIITHDYLYQLFSPYGQIVKILIFQKAKVWKTFIEFQNSYSAIQALTNLNNKVIFQDGSKMNIFHSKLKHVQFQNDNLGGVNYQNLKSMQEIPQDMFQQSGIRKRNSTFQDHFSHAHETSMRQFVNYQYFEEPRMASKIFSSKIPEQNIHYTLQHSDDTFHKSESIKPIFCMENSDSTFHRSETVNSKKSYGGSFNNLGDIDDLFRQIALQSTEFREWQEIQLKNRKKSKTIVNPLSEQFVIENCPSRVIFIRSIPENYNHHCLYNIFINFGSITRMIFMKDKCSALIEYEQLYEAIRAKDQINYVKSDLKIFYSHYESLVLRKDSQDELNFDYSNTSVKNHSMSNVSTTSKKKPFNPPSQVLYLTMVNPSLDNQLKKKCLQIGCKIKNMEWKQNGKDKWMCLVQFNSIKDSLTVLGMLQNETMSNGRKLRLAFTRSKISSSPTKDSLNTWQQERQKLKIFNIPEQNPNYEENLAKS